MISVFAVLCSLAAFTSHLTGRRPQRPLVRSIPPDRYYLWESVFLTPVTVGWMVLFTRLVRRGARRHGGVGTYDGDFTTLAIGHTMP